jgi:hypothetical protein
VAKERFAVQLSDTVANFWPTRSQELLLRACLLRGDEALEAWREWEKLFGEGEVGAAERRLLPLLYRNLRDHDVRGPLVGRLKEEYSHAWSQNQFSFHGAAELVRAFDRVGIQTILLKGAGLATLFYEDTALRPMADVDLLVRRRDAPASIRLLNSRGWKSRYESAEALVPFEHAVEFTGASHLNIDLHWRALWEGLQEAGDEEFWGATIPAEVGGAETRTLNPSDHLLHVCVHGAKWNDTAPVRWVADAMMILRSRKYKVDWNRLVRLSRQRQLTLPLRDALAYLRQSLGAPVPEEVLSDLQSAPTSRLERQFYRIRLGPNDALRTFPVLWHWFGSLCSECDGNPFQRIAQFLQYLQCLWGVSRTRDVPAHFVGRLARRTYQLAKWRLRRKWAATRPAE